MLSPAPPDQPARYQDKPRLVYGSKGRDAGELWSPQGVAVDLDTGDIHVADNENYRVNMYSDTGRSIKSYGYEMMVFRPLLCTLLRLNWATYGSDTSDVLMVLP